MEISANSAVVSSTLVSSTPSVLGGSKLPRKTGQRACDKPCQRLDPKFENFGAGITPLNLCRIANDRMLSRWVAVWGVIAVGGQAGGLPVHSTPPTLADGWCESTDVEWMAMLHTPPPNASSAFAQLAARADTIAAELDGATLTVAPGEYDFVCSGGGNFDAFFFGVYQVFRRISLKHNITLKRWAGASAGGMAPFELLLKGETTTITEHLAYGMLMEQNPDCFPDSLVAALLQDHHASLPLHFPHSCTHSERAVGRWQGVQQRLSGRGVPQPRTMLNTRVC